MKRILSYFTVLATVVTLIGGCDKEDQVTGPGGDGSSGVPDGIAISPNIPALLADGVDQLTLRATVVDSRGKALPGVGIVFATSRGSIDPFGTTDERGVASTLLTSEASASDITASVTAAASTDTSHLVARLGPAAAGRLRQVVAGSLPAGAVVLLSHEPLDDSTLRRALEARAGRAGSLRPTGAAAQIDDAASVSMKGITVTVSANPGTIPADGLSESRIIARVIETTSRVPLEGVEVRFGASAGSVTGRVTTDPTGTAVATLTGVTSGATANVTAFFGKTLTVSTAVSFSPLTLSLRAAAAAITADGRSSTGIIARLVNAEHNPVAGARVEFSTTRGTIASPAVTDAAGEAAALLTAGSEVGPAGVTARFGTLTGSLTVDFTAPPVSQSILLSVDPASLPADGGAEATLTARVLDSQGRPMPDGTSVTFSIVSGGGRIIAPAALTTGGEAQAIYVAAATPGAVSLRATSGAATGNSQLTLVPLDAGLLTFSAAATSVLADGLSSTTLTATVTDNFGNPVAAGTLVTFTTTRGVLEGATPTDALGLATVRLRAGRFETGLARVTASVGEVRRTLDVNFVSESANHIVVLELDQPRLGIRGTGSPQTATLTFEVRDRFGIPVDAGHPATVNFLMVPVGGVTDATLAAASAVTNERGRVAAVVRAGLIAGAVEVQATSGAIESKPIRVAIHGDLPDPAHFSLSFERVNIAGLVFDGIRNAVTARVGDQNGNPVPDSTAVWFNAQYGLVQGSAFTDDHGEATVWEVTAGPHPAIPLGDGLVTIEAQTVSKAGDRITTSGQVMWSGPTILEITDPLPGAGFSVPNGGAVTIQFRVRDANGNPLVGGTQISVDATIGNLGGDDAVVLPDTQSDGYTFFSVTLADDDTEETDPSKRATVTITVTSQNGNATASITGSVD